MCLGAPARHMQITTVQIEGVVVRFGATLVAGVGYGCGEGCGCAVVAGRAEEGIWVGGSNGVGDVGGVCGCGVRLCGGVNWAMSKSLKRVVNRGMVEMASAAEGVERTGGWTI